MSASINPPAQITSDLQTGILINFALCGLFGLLVNTLILIALYKKFKKEKIHTDVKICTFVSFIDTLVSLGLIFRSILAKYPYNIFKFSPEWCKFEAVAITQLMNCSGYILAIMSIEKFLLVCFNIELPSLILFVLMFLVIALNQSFTIASVVLNLQVLNITQVSCTVIVKEVGYICYMVSTVLFMISFIIVVFSYFSIMIAKAKQCLNQINLNVPKNTVYAELRTTLFKSILYILLYILVFSAKFYSLVYTTLAGKKKTLLMDAVSTILLSYSPSVNALILLYMNQKIRIDFIKLIKSIKSKFIQPQY